MHERATLPPRPAELALDPEGRAGLVLEAYLAHAQAGPRPEEDEETARTLAAYLEHSEGHHRGREP